MEYEEGQELHGFALCQIVLLPELNTTLLRLEHRGTGARYIHLAAPDDNNLFAVGFRTPPRDSTGVAHILEHTALCGSRRYPVRDPFFSMIKRSLNTFMNAMTAADWTLYPFSTQNRRDFRNLLGVYLDAAFFPLLRERDFRQEGWRLEFEDPADPASPLVYKGVVYNEMKGAMADPHSLLGQRVAEALYPTSTYGRNSGGEPARIPDLTWEGLRAFHAACYHPSNAYFFTYGDIPLEEHLEIVERLALREFGRAEADTAVGVERRFAAPRRAEAGFPIGPGEPLVGKTMVQMAWLNGSVTDSFGRVAMDLLSALLLGNPASPLHKALLDSKLGANLAPGCGYNGENRETCFEAGLQGTEPDRASSVEELILSTLDRAAGEGFSRERIEAAIHRLEFAHREVRGNHYPYGLSLVSRVMGPWIHGGDPVSALSLSADLERLRRELAQGPFFQELIRSELLANPHRVTLTLRPDPSFTEREERELSERLAANRAALTAEAAQALVEQAAELQRAQEAVEDLSCLPTLGVGDIPPTERFVGWSERGGEVPVRWFDQPTNGIGYFTAYLGADELPPDLLPLVPLFCSLLTQVGAAGRSHTEMAERVEAATGGVGASPVVLESPSSVGAFRAVLAAQAKALTRNQGRMFDILSDYFAAPDFKDLDRIRTVLGQLRTNLENSVPNVGHRYASRAAAASLTASGRRRELWSGVDHVRLVRRCAGLDDSGLQEFAGRLERLADLLLTRQRLSCGVSGESATFNAVRDPLDAFLGGLRAVGGAGGSGAGKAFSPVPVRRGFSASVPVCYVARVFPCVPYTHADAGGLLVLAKLLKSGFLHREIREKGGAYGGLCGYDPEGGLMTLLSYRDPHLARTLRIYDDAARWAVSRAFDAEAVNEAILAVFADLDRPLSPSGKADRELANQEQGLTAAMRQELRDNARAADAGQLAALAEVYLIAGRPLSAVAAVANEEALKRANDELGEEGLEIERL